MMNMPEASTFNDPSYIISTDDAAKRILSDVVPNDQAGAALLDIAKDVTDHYSFVDHQTYPRPGHALTRKRLPPEFTFVSIIVSLRCTLSTEQVVTDRLIAETNGNVDALKQLDIDTIREIIRPSGMSKQKSIWITNGLDQFNNNLDYHIDRFYRSCLEDARNRLLKLNGMGAKATDCFLLLGLNRPSFPVDVNVFKLISRLFPEQIASDTGVVPDFSKKLHANAAKCLLERSFTRDTKAYQVLHIYLLLANKYGVA